MMLDESRLPLPSYKEKSMQLGTNYRDWYSSRIGVESSRSTGIVNAIGLGNVLYSFMEFNFFRIRRKSRKIGANAWLLGCF